MSLTCALLVFCFVTWLVRQLWWRRRLLPPGPMPWPVFGNLLAFAASPPGYEVMLRWRREFGPLFTFWWGPVPAIVIADYATLKETLINDGTTYTGRFTFEEHCIMVRGGRFGIVETEGPLWAEQRKFMLRVFRDLGVNRRGIEQRVLNEVAYLVDALGELSRRSEAVNPKAEIDRTVGSVINGLLFGYGFQGRQGIDEFVEIKGLFDRHMTAVLQPLTTLAMVKPKSLGRLPVLKDRLAEVHANMSAFFAFFDRQIDAVTAETPVESIASASNYCEAFLLEAQRQEESNESEHTFTRAQLRSMCLDLWIAGLESTTNTCLFAILYAIHHPECQQRLHDELDDVVASDRLVTAADHHELAYLNAFVAETQRMANLLPLNLVRKTTRDTTIRGHFIPAESYVMPQISCVLFDESVFPEPFSFKPERFIDENGNFRHIEEMVPFSVGRRQCVGESLARMELFLIIGNLFNRFSFEPLPGRPLPPLEKKLSMIVHPASFACRVRDRYENNNCC